MSVVKANAYGHGLEHVAQAVRNDVDAFGVYEVAEGLALRDYGVTQPIHVLGPVPPAECAAAIRADLILPLWDRGGWLEDVRHAATAAGRKARVQLKIDTGLARLGLAPNATAVALADYLAMPELEVCGAYSHLAAAEELDSRFTLEQLERFAAAVPPGGVRQRHIAASAAALLWPQTRLDLIRVGIAQYGIWPSDGTRARLEADLPLQPTLSWQTKLVAIREAAAETPVGYGSTYRPPNATRIGILPIGYAEGLGRALSNCGSVLIDGARCPLVGRVCMNMAFVDLAPASNARVGATVTLIGSDQTATITSEDIARLSNTIGYEIVARLPREIPRVLVDIERAQAHAQPLSRDPAHRSLEPVPPNRRR